jgi:hypothetical protein
MTLVGDDRRMMEDHRMNIESYCQQIIICLRHEIKYYHYVVLNVYDKTLSASVAKMFHIVPCMCLWQANPFSALIVYF